MPTVLITGTSTGIGHVTTGVLAARGWRVFATMCDLTREDSLEGALENAALRYRVMICQLDVSDAESIHAAVASILAQTDAIDAVVHNAGVAVAGALEDLPSLIASTSTDKCVVGPSPRLAQRRSLQGASLDPHRRMSAIGTKRTSADRVARSGSGRKADMPNQRVECPLMTQSGHFTLFCHLQDRKAGTSEASYLISGSPASTAVSGVESCASQATKSL